MPLSAASALHAFLLALLLGVMASAAADDGVGVGDVNTTMFTNATASAGNTEIYICYLCAGRNPLLIRYCPIYWDECHLVCYADASSAATAAIPAAPTPAPLPPSLATAHRHPSASGVQDEECYVMKLYWNGSYTIVSRRGCAQIARCLLSCGGGDMADRKALGTATTRAIQGSFPPQVADFQRCGSQVTAPLAPASAVVPAGGARRRRR
ncbi:hypothetical protein U9M48_006708 [Paspalum notatum var. saurae]|uniref:Uncharacterized protein n=1 Tax=Paspalum notatum var. saurae TaxID=547442 RepID=A0AAQ3Q0F2_PASNO